MVGRLAKKMSIAPEISPTIAYTLPKQGDFCDKRSGGPGFRFLDPTFQQCALIAYLSLNTFAQAPHRQLPAIAIYL